MVKIGFEFEHGSPLNFGQLNSSFSKKFPTKPVGTYNSSGVPICYSFHDDYSVYYGDCKATAELVTPPLPFEQGVQDCIDILTWMTEEKALTGNTSGLHVGMSFIDPENQTKVKNDLLKFTKLLFGIPEIELLKSFGRYGNKYSQSLKEHIRNNVSSKKPSLRIIESILTLFSGHGWYSMTLDKLCGNNSYVEFRMLGGPNYNERIAEIISVLNIYKNSYEKILDTSPEYEAIIKDRVHSFLAS